MTWISLLGVLCVAACAERPRSAAAEVSRDDVRRLPPSRRDNVPDVMMQAADRGRVLGVDAAPVQLFVVSDYQCEACRQWFERLLPALQEKYVTTGRIRLTWVHYPLREHPHAAAAAAIALCASAQGRFLEASGGIFAAQATWGAEPSVDAAARRIEASARVPGVDSVALSQCVESRRMLRQVRYDIDWVDKAGQGHPPAVLLGTRPLANPTSWDALRSAIDSSLAGR